MSQTVKYRDWLTWYSLTYSTSIIASKYKMIFWYSKTICFVNILTTNYMFHIAISGSLTWILWYVTSKTMSFDVSACHNPKAWFLLIVSLLKETSWRKHVFMRGWCLCNTKTGVYSKHLASVLYTSVNPSEITHTIVLNRDKHAKYLTMKQ